MLFKAYPIFVSDRKNKKYYAVVKTLSGNKKVYFGDSRYQHFFDKLGKYKHLNHLDPVRRKLYKARHEKDRHIVGTAGWFADKILW